MDKSGDGRNVLTLDGGWTASILDFAGQSDPQWRRWLIDLVHNPVGLLNTRTLKTSDTVDVIQTRLCESGPEVICKHSKYRGAWNRISAMVRGTHAGRNARRAKWLIDAGIRTARPIAIVEHLSGSSWIVAEYLSDLMDLDTFVMTTISNTGRVPAVRRRRLIDEVATVFCRLEQAGLYHRDMKASNILIQSNDAPEPGVFIVDLDGLEQRRPWRSRYRPLARLAASLLQYDSVSRADYGRFLRSYLTAGGQKKAWRTLYPRLARQAVGYEQRARGRKFNKFDGYA